MLRRNYCVFYSLASFTATTVHCSCFAASQEITCHASSQPAPSCSTEGFKDFSEAAEAHNFVPVYRRIMSDKITAVGAYQRLSRGDRNAPSFLFESVQNGIDTGRFSFVGAWPDLEILGVENKVTVLDHCKVWI